MNELKLSSTRRWISSERIAIRLLEELGFRVVETRKRIIVNGVEVGEADVIVVDGNNQYWSVEIKAGKVDVSGVRQAYVNALLLNMKPMIICKGFADDSATQLAEILGVKVIQLSDIFLVESEELEVILREVIEDTLADYLDIFFNSLQDLKQEYLDVLKSIDSTTTLEEAAEKLGVDVSTLTKKLSDMRSLGIIPKWAKKYSSIKRIARIYVQRANIASMIEESQKLVEAARSLAQTLQQLSNTLTQIQKQLHRLQQVQAIGETKQTTQQVQSQ